MPVFAQVGPSVPPESSLSLWRSPVMGNPQLVALVDDAFCKVTCGGGRIVLLIPVFSVHLEDGRMAEPSQGG